MAATSATTIQEIMFDIGIWDRHKVITCLRQGTMATALQLEAQGCTDYKLIARLKEYRAWDHESLAKCIGVSGATLRYYCKRHRVRINAPYL